jgi:hypothetical protein
MTIADAFNEITIAQGGTPNYSGTIAAAIDSLNDTLAGSDQPADPTIEGAVRLLGQHIGGGAAASGTYTFTMWSVDSTGTMATDGDYATARASLADGRPIAPVVCTWNFDQSYPYFGNLNFLSPELTENSIKLYYSSTEGYEWDEDGITAF